MSNTVKKTIQILPSFDNAQNLGLKDILNCRGRRAAATGQYIEGSLIVFAGSLSNRLNAGSSRPSVVAIRQRLVSEGILEIVDGGALRFTKDYIFPSPSQAASVVLARNANGWTAWKYADGRTLETIRQK